MATGTNITITLLRCTCHVFCLLQGALSDNEEDSALADLKDLEFKLLHDLTQLQVASPVTEPNLVPSPPQFANQRIKIGKD